MTTRAATRSTAAMLRSCSAVCSCTRVYASRGATHTGRVARAAHPHDGPFLTAGSFLRRRRNLEGELMNLRGPLLPSSRPRQSCLPLPPDAHRFLSAPDKLKFVVEPFNIIDAIAILPWYIITGVGNDFKGTTVFRVVRLLRVFRVLKLGGR